MHLIFEFLIIGATTHTFLIMHRRFLFYLWEKLLENLSYNDINLKGKIPGYL